MAAIKDPALGLVPKGQPKLFKTFTTSEEIVKYQPVKLAAGYIVDAVQTSSDVLGVAMCHADSGDEVIVCIDPDVIYEATGDVIAVAADVGQYANMVDSSLGVALGGNRTSSAVLNLPATTTGTGRYCYVVGLPTTVTNAAPAAEFKVLVKLIATQFVS